MSQNNRNTLLHLNLIDAVGPATITTLIEWCTGVGVDLCALYELSLADLRRTGVSEVRAQALFDGLRDNRALERELVLLEKHVACYTTIIDDDYPEFLRHITVPPSVLYYRGALAKNFDRSIALVGTRHASQYARRVTHDFVAPLTGNGWAIVSGGAIGVDTWAHEAALDNNGRTLAVLGSGLLVLYPACNKALFSRIVENGGVLMSPFKLEQQPLVGTFPARNRIIAGMSQAVVVVQAGIKSGALITARYALEQGRQVCAVPGGIDDVRSAGCHQLIQQGAKLVTCARDVVCEPVGPREQPLLPTQEPAWRACADPLEREIMALCRQPRSLDELCDELGVMADSVRERLFGLQCAGLVEQDFAGLFCAR